MILFISIILTIAVAGLAFTLFVVHLIRHMEDDNERNLNNND